MAPPSTEGSTLTTIHLASPRPQRQPGGLPEVTTRAMEGFACLAERCEDTCCKDWAVPINRADLNRMTDAMSRTAEGRERLVRLVVIGNVAHAPDGLGQLQMDDQCTCPMLETDNRCGVHATFGEDALTTPCAVFPRTALAVPVPTSDRPSHGGRAATSSERLEVGGSLGCPEVARLTLLADEEMELRPAPRPMLPRAYVGKTVSVASEGGYAQHFLAVREALLQCFRQDHLALGTQFVLAADYAQRTHPLVHRGTTEFQGAQRAFAEHRLHAEITHTRSPELHAALASDLAALTASGEAVASFIGSLLSDRLRLPHGPRFARLLDDVSSSLEGEAAGRPSDVPAPAGMGQQWSVYNRRRGALDSRFGRRLTALFSRYSQHFLLRNPYTDGPTLLQHVYALGVHLAALRFLVVGHPRLAAVLATDPDSEEDGKVLNEVMVHVVQTFTKAVSHHPAFLRAAGLDPGLADVAVTFGRLVLLAKFL